MRAENKQTRSTSAWDSRRGTVYVAGMSGPSVFDEGVATKGTLFEEWVDQCSMPGPCSSTHHHITALLLAHSLTFTPSLHAVAFYRPRRVLQPQVSPSCEEAMMSDRQTPTITSGTASNTSPTKHH
jgi:hypothetical protein